MPTYQIHIKGVVQGVGFRPHVFRMAQMDDLKGTVQNGSTGVIIQINARDFDVARSWMKRVVAEAPSISKIQSSQLTEVEDCVFSDFQITESVEEGPVDTPLTPDFGMCEDCRRELEDAGNRRFDYAFTTCTHCGPRYSITRKIPYDRPNTTMDEFEMCPSCQKEYNDITDRRHYSQTNSCPDCAIRLRIYDTRERIYFPFHRERDKINYLVTAIESGQILAIKGIGGYLLMCDARDDVAITLLRERKRRPKKPFAVMYPDMRSVEAHYRLSANERKALTSPESPIVLLQPHRHSHLSNLVAPGLSTVGVMLPYAPLLRLIAKGTNIPLIATSANVSGSPIIYDDAQAIDELSSIADWIVSHNRQILIPQDDSVVRYTHEQDRRIMLRRSRGFAPNYFGPPSTLEGLEGALAVGAEMKGCLGLVHAGKIYLSQYLGSMEHLHSQTSFECVLHHLQSVLGFEPKLLISDQHPSYFGYSWCDERAQSSSTPWNRYQHHQAHFASVLAENDLLDAKEPVLGFIWDGTGLSPNQQIWGSETFVWENGQLTHAGNMGMAPHLSGDKMALQPRISLLAMTRDEHDIEAYVRPYFLDREWQQLKLIKQKSTLRTSSMGRLFDAIACLLTNTAYNTFEGQAAMYLEDIAGKAREAHMDLPAWELDLSTPFYQQVLNLVYHSLNAGMDKSAIALQFHRYLVDWIRRQATASTVRKLAFSGGVFQNALLVDLIIHQLSDEYELFFHRELPSNDENIAHGQLMLAWLNSGSKIFNAEETHTPNEIC